MTTKTQTDPAAREAAYMAKHIVVSHEEYVRACRLLSIHAGRGLAAAKQNARLVLDTAARDMPLRHKAAAALILRATPFSAKH